MDSLIHYEPADVVHALGALAPRTVDSMVITFAPRTPLLAAMHMAGQFFPRSDRSPAIIPVAQDALVASIRGEKGLADWRVGRMHRVSRGFYISQALEVART